MVSENAKNAYADVVKSIQMLSTDEKKDLVVRLQNHIKYEIFGNCPNTKKSIVRNADAKMENIIDFSQTSAVLQQYVHN